MTSILNTKLLMTTSSTLMGLIGIGINFMSNEVLENFRQKPDETLNLKVQLTGSLYFRFAMTN
jgi:hypothetical protein